MSDRNFRFLCASFTAGAILLPIAAFAQSAPVVAQQSDTATLYANSAAALFKLLVLSVLIDQALSALFSWRLYRELFDGRGFKTIVMVAISYLAVTTFNMDVVYEIMKEYGYKEKPGWLSQGLTALILSGGSGGVNALLQRFGIRHQIGAEAKPMPKSGKAWISVSVTRKSTTKDVRIMLGVADPQPQMKPVPLAGFLRERSLGERIAGIFFRDQDRMPPSGGHEIDASKVYSLRVSAIGADGNLLSSPIDGEYMFAEGAILDLHAEI